MLVKELIKQLKELDQDLEIVTRYGENQVADPQIDFIPFDSIENIGEDCYWISAGENIRNTEEN